MSLGDEQELLINQNNTSSNNGVVPIAEQSPSTSPEELPIPNPRPTGLFAKLKSKKAYCRLAVMSEASPNLQFTRAHSEQLPKKSKPARTPKGSQTPTITNTGTNIETKTDDQGNDNIVHAPESPTLRHLYPIYSSKDDLDLPSAARMSQPRASAVNPISIPLHQSQRQITLDTDFDVVYKPFDRATRSFSHGTGDTNTASPSAATPGAPNKNKKEKEKETESFTKNIVVYEDVDVSIAAEEETKFSDVAHGGDEQVAIDIINEDNPWVDNKKPPFLKNKSADVESKNNDDVVPIVPSLNKRLSVKEVFSVIKKGKDKEQQPQLSQVNEVDKKEKKRKTKLDKKGILAPKVPKGRKLKKEKSVFDAFKKEKKVDLSNIKNLPMSLKTHLNDDSSDHAIQLILDHIRDLDDQKKDYIYEQLVKDKEFIPRICNKLLSATDAKHNEIVCIWIYDFFNEQNPNARLFALQFIPCLIWCVMTRPPKCVSGAVAALLSLYKKECNIFDKLSYGLINNTEMKSNEDVSDLLRYDRDASQSSAQQYGVSCHHNIFPKFEMPDLDLPSIYHEPNKSSSTSTNNNPTAPTQIFKSSANGNVMRGKLINVKSNGNVSKKQKKKISERDIKHIRDLVFPPLNQANLSTNLHLIYVALQVFNHYITRVSKPSICLEQMCAVIAKLCSSGIDASQPMRFPDVISEHFAWDWKWYTEDMVKEKQHEKYILPSQIMSQFLSSIRYSLKQTKTRNIAKFALGQVHKRGHIDMIPEIILQTTSMLHSAFMDGLTF